MQLYDDLPPEVGDDLRPSALFVYAVLVDTEALTTKALSEKTMLHKRTVRNALTELREQDLVERQPVPGEPRRFQYRTTSLKSSPSASTSPAT